MWVKICGITTEEDALLAVAMGADALGFVFAAGSTRQVAAARVADIVKRLPPDILTIGVFRDEVPERVVQVVQRCGLGGAQLHGHEAPEVSAIVAADVAFVIQAFKAGDPQLAKVGRYRIRAVMIDGAEAGSGQSFDWSLAEDIPSRLPLILAGGLHPRNVAAAVAQVRPWGVDVSTGVERAPGHKDPRKVRSFIRAAKAAGAAAEGVTLDGTADPDEIGLLEQPVEFSPEGSPYDWQDDL